MFYYSPIQRLPVRFKNPTNSTIPWKWRGGYVLQFSNSTVASPFHESDELENSKTWPPLHFHGMVEFVGFMKRTSNRGNGDFILFITN